MPRRQVKRLLCFIIRHKPQQLASVTHIPIVPGLVMEAVPSGEICRRCGKRLKSKKK